MSRPSSILRKAGNDKAVTWVTRGFEVAAVLSSLLWAVEAGANSRQQPLSPTSSKVDIERRLASVTKDMKSNAARVKAQKSPFESMLAPKAVYFGESLSPSFKETMMYVSTSFAVFRFPTFK